MLEDVLSVLAALVVLGTGSLPFLFLGGYLRHRKRRPTDTRYAVRIIIPCKEKGPHLRENLAAFCVQDYPSYQVRFVVDSDSDAAYETVCDVVRSSPNASMVFATRMAQASGKVSALLTGITDAQDIDVFVFADSDVCPHPGWLASLVTPLTDPRVGATTGYRWFFHRGWASSFISTWNMSTMSALFYQPTTFSWGGSTAIRTAVFDDLGIAKRWRTGFSDDLILTDSLKQVRLRIEFVPRCVSESPAEEHLSQFVRWGSQQLTWVRWYNPLMWTFYFIGILFLTAVTVLSLLSFAFGYLWPGALILIALALEMVYGMAGILTFQKLMAYPPQRFRHKARFGLLMPGVLVMYAYNAVGSAVKQEIRWAGKTYRKEDALKAFQHR